MIGHPERVPPRRDESKDQHLSFIEPQTRGKTPSKGLCNKGTTSVGPTKSAKWAWASAPAIFVSDDSAHLADFFSKLFCRAMKGP
jgi:hypothetical protein